MSQQEFDADFDAFATAAKGHERFPMSREDLHPCLTDRTASTGFDRHYVYHTSWAARVLAETRPGLHIDIASSLYFAGIASAFVPIDFYDYRPANLHLSTLQSRAADLMKLPFATGSVASLSCMHVIEHIGLGRYGDPIDPEGDLKAIAELTRVVATGGSLLCVVPIGKPRIAFNAHRIYAYRQVVEAFSTLKLHQFALIPEKTPPFERHEGLLIDATEAQADAESYGCGCFWFKK